MPRPESQIHIWNATDLAFKRDQLVDDVFGADLPSEVGTLESVASPVVVSGATCEKMTMVAYPSRPRVWTPAVPNGDLMILHQGHSGTYGSYSMTPAIQAYVDAGFTVCGLVMPRGVDEVTSGTSSSHNTNEDPLDEYLGPVVIAINTLEGSVDHIYMSGLSGGGWTTTLCAALDTRIEKSYPTAGSLPLNMPLNRDHEQYLEGLRVGYLDLYLLGACGAGRRQKQILHTLDDCCFKLSQYQAQRPYADTIAAMAASLGGDYDLVWREKEPHEFDATIIDEEVLAELAP